MFESLYNYLYHQDTSGGIPLKGTGILLALALIAVHAFALLRGDAVQRFLKEFPRHYKWGVVLLSIDFAWSMLILAYMDMGEFYHLRKWFLILVPIGFVLVLLYVQEFLSVRALGSLLLLLAGPVLTAAFLQPQTSRLLLPVLAYVWIFVGMFFVGMPYLMRDWVDWITTGRSRWKIATLAGLVYGVVMLIAAVADY